LQAAEVAKLSADIEDLNIPVGPIGQISIRIIKPKGNKEILPIVMYFHGGGWVLGGKDTHDRLVREIANGANAAVVFVNFTPSPEAKYPAPIEEAYAATKYIAEHGKNFNLDTSRLAVAGDSVGGNMAAAVILLAKERGGPKIDYQVLFYPVTDANFDTPSYQQFAKDIWLTREAMKWFWNNYLPYEKARKQPTASPLHASIDQLKGQPPALIITDENDVLRDEGESYAHKLIQAGVNVTAVRYLGTIHDFLMLNALAGTPATCSAIGLANENLRNVFAKS
jgi:acetyl esterase/lipase